jgi:hypothetical protein
VPQRQEILGTIPGWVLGKFSSDLFLCPHTVPLGCTQPVTDMSTKGTVRSACTADSSAVVVLPTVKGRMKAQHSIPTLSFNVLLRERFAYTFSLYRQAKVSEIRQWLQCIQLLQFGTNIFSGLLQCLRGFPV